VAPCNQKFTQKALLFQHLEAAHVLSPQEHYTCRLCGFITTSLLSNVRHEGAHLDLHETQDLDETPAVRKASNRTTVLAASSGAALVQSAAIVVKPSKLPSNTFKAPIPSLPPVAAITPPTQASQHLPSWGQTLLQGSGPPQAEQERQQQAMLYYYAQQQQQHHQQQQQLLLQQQQQQQQQQARAAYQQQQVYAHQQAMLFAAYAQQQADK
jgi:hypothetical protein